MPSKTKKRAMIQPTWPVLTPYMPPQQQPMVNAPEPVTAVGDVTGTPYFRMGDNPNGPETIQVTPPAGGRAMPAISGGPVSMARGGIATVGYNPTDEDLYDSPSTANYGVNANPAVAPATANVAGGIVNSAVSAGQQAVDASQRAQILSQPAPQLGITGGGPDPLANQNQAAVALIGARNTNLDAQGRTIDAQGNVIDARGNVIDAQGNVINAREATLPYQQGVLDARTGVANATQNTFAPSRAVINAEGNVIGAQGRMTEGTRAYIGDQQQANRERMGETAGIQNAATNVEDITNVARARRDQTSKDYIYGMGGLNTPEEVVLPPDFNGKLPPGVRAKIQTQEEILTNDSKNAEQIRALKLDDARLVVQLMGTDVEKAQQAAARAGLTLKEAQLLVDEAQNNASRAGIALDQSGMDVSRAQIGADRAQQGVDRAQQGADRAQNDQNRTGLGVSRAQLGTDAAEMPPAPGMVIDVDPFSGKSEWVTPAEKTMRTERRNAQGVSGNQLAAFSPSYIVGLAVSDQVDDQTATDALVAQGYTPAQAMLMIQQGRRESGGGDGSDIV